MKTILLIFILLFTTIGFAQFRKTAPVRTQTVISKSIVSPTLLKIQKLLLSAMGNPAYNIKAGKGTQDGGGGFIDELELRQVINQIVVSMRAYLPVIKSMEILDAQQIVKFREIFANQTISDEKLCVIIALQKPGLICPKDTFEVFLEQSVWRVMDEVQRNDFAINKILEIIGIPEYHRKEKARRIDFIVNKRTGRVHRYDIQNMNSGKFYAYRNKRTNKTYALRWTAKLDSQNNEAYNLNISTDENSASQDFILNPKSPLLQLSPCHDDVPSQEFTAILDSFYAISEFQPLVKKCFELIRSGQKIESIWVKEGQNLVVNCR